MPEENQPEKLPPTEVVGETAHQETTPEMMPRVLFGRKPKWTIIRLSVLIVLSFLTFKFMLVPIRVTGVSMYPTYADGEVNLINRWGFINSQPKRGDVVGVRMEENGPIFLKRIIGMPGERFSIVEGWIMINGEALDESYVFKPKDWGEKEVLLSEEQYYVLGDNRSMDQGSHFRFVVDREQIIGKVLIDKTPDPSSGS